MSGRADNSDLETTKTDDNPPLVKRTAVPALQDYTEYKPYLRKDFYWSCAYCGISECEAQGLRMTIDHYEPKSARPDLTTEYSNLMYACDECNMRKGNRYPPAKAREEGFRFYRPDRDLYDEHFIDSGIRLDPKDNVGYFSIQALDLNRQSLRTLRDIRQRIVKAHQVATIKISELQKFHIDRLPQHLKGTALRAIKNAADMAKKIPDDIDELLRSHAQSPLIEDEPEDAEHVKYRKEALKQLQGMFPESWRPEGKRKKKAG